MVVVIALYADRLTRTWVQVLDDTVFAIFVIMALTTTVLATPFMTALYRHPPTATTPKSDVVELKGGDACPA